MGIRTSFVTRCIGLKCEIITYLCISLHLRSGKVSIRQNDVRIKYRKLVKYIYLDVYE